MRRPSRRSPRPPRHGGRPVTRQPDSGHRRTCTTSSSGGGCSGSAPCRAAPLTVIHAPAGYGKTTLAVQWLAILQDDGALVAWLGLHGDDNDPHWFLAHLLEAVRRALPSAEEAIGDLRELIEQNAEDMQGYTLSALLEVVGATRAGSCSRSTTGTSSTTSRCTGRWCTCWTSRHRTCRSDPDQPPPAAVAVEPAARAGAPGGDRRRRAALRPRRDPGVPRRAQRAAASTATTSRGSPRAPTDGSRRCSWCRCRCGTAPTRRADQRLLRTSPLGRRVPRRERPGRAARPRSSTSCWPPRSATDSAATSPAHSPAGPTGRRCSRSSRPGPVPASARRRAGVVPLPPPVRRLPPPSTRARPSRTGSSSCTRARRPGSPSTTWSPRP